MARPKDRLPGKDLVVRKLVLNGIGNACVAADAAGGQYEPLIFLGPRMVKEVETALEALGETSFRRNEGLLAISICGVSRWNPSLLDHRPNATTD